MPTKRSYLIPLSVVVLCIVGGCNTPTTPQQNRINTMQAEYEKMRPAEKTEIAKGAIAVGFRLEMVYMALGRPDEIETFSDGREVQWRYRNFYPSAQIAPGSLYGIPKLDPLQKASSRWMNASRSDAQDEVRNGVELRSAPAAAIDSRETNIGPPGVTLDVIFSEGKVVEYRINDQAS